MTRLVGLTGPAGCGKDTAAQALVAQGYRRDAFADRMRTALLALDPIVDEGLGDGACPERLSEIVGQYGWESSKRNVPEIRRLLQKFGTEAGRDIHGADCWVDALLDEWDGEALVITDVRFDNEAQAIRDFGGRIIHLRRTGLAALPGNHASEAGVSTAHSDHLIVNDGTVEELHRLVLAAVGIEPKALPRLYISGPMSGIAGHNFPAFNAAAEALRAVGYEVENPADTGLVDGWKWEDYLRHDLRLMCELDALATLPGWLTSRGANLEVLVARKLGMPVHPVEHWLAQVNR